MRAEAQRMAEKELSGTLTEPRVGHRLGCCAFCHLGQSQLPKAALELILQVLGQQVSIAASVLQMLPPPEGNLHLRRTF